MILKFGVKVVKHILDDFTIIFNELQIPIATVKHKDCNQLFIA